MSKELWVEKYRPKKLREYVWRDDAQREQVEKWLGEGYLPNLLLAGIHGTGKTSLILMLLALLEIPEDDILKINASSKKRKADEMEDEINNFIYTFPVGPSGMKYVVLEEADSMTPLTQRFLREVVEMNHEHCRFAFVCNDKNKIIKPIRSRLQGFTFDALEYEDYIARSGEILGEENVEYEFDTLLQYTEAFYPDLRALIGSLQQNTVKNKLGPFRKDQVAAKDYLVAIADLYKAGKYVEARQSIVDQATVDDYDDIYRYFYQNLGIWSNDTNKQDEALLIISEGLVYHSMTSDPEINLAATMVKLSRL